MKIIYKSSASKGRSCFYNFRQVFYINFMDVLLAKYASCVSINITEKLPARMRGRTKEGERMIMEIDFNGEEAIYIQLRNQIIIGIATSQLKEGDTLPSVRQLAELVGINMHTVNKAYSVLREEGYIKIDRRRGAVIAIDIDKLRAMEEIKEELLILLARASLKNITADEVHEMIDEIFAEYGCPGTQRD